MRALRSLGVLLLPGLALLLLGAHFLRAGLMPLTVLCLGAMALLFVRTRWSWLALQAALWIGALEWLRTAWVFAAARAQFGQPYARLLAILGTVALLSAVAALVLRSDAGRDRFVSPR